MERFQQTLKQWLRNQPPATTLNDLQALLDIFVDTYNNHRPHRSLRRTTPADAYQQLPKATPTSLANSHYRTRQDIVGDNGVITLRHAGRLHHIGIGRSHAQTPVILLIADLDIRIINTTTGELLSQLTLDPDRDYQPRGRPPGPPKKTQLTDPLPDNPPTAPPAAGVKAGRRPPEGHRP